MAPRALWTGSIAFGLVNVPVRIFSAVHEHKLRFHLLHVTDNGPIGYRKVCKLEDEPVPDDEIVKAYEVRKGEFVPLDDEDFEAVHVEGQHTIELEDFVEYTEIDPTFFAHTYVVGPQEGTERTYALLVRTMERSGLAGIGKFVMRGRQYLGCLRVREGLLTLEQMHFADEVDPPSEIVPGELPEVGKRELEMALSLVEGFSGPWQPEKYRDTYTDALLEIVDAKAKGREVRAVQAPAEEEPPDLIEALRRSIEQARGRRPGSEPTKRELEEQARELGIEGRSRMTKKELARAVEVAGRR
jgi:DNA end-binding protein Ku